MQPLTFPRYLLPITAAALLAGCGGSQPPIGAPGAILGARPYTTASKKFKFTGAAQTFVVPNNVTAITVTAYGASGGNDGTNDVMGGKGGMVKAVLPVTSGETLYVFVGGEGVNGYNGLAGAGGFNGGGAGGAGGYTSSSANGGNGGAGASDVRQGGSALADRVLVAGGGGGAGGADFQGINGPGGAGGGKIGGKGGAGDGAGGFGGTQMHGGKGGAGGARTQGHGHAAHGKRGQLGSGGTGGCCKAGQLISPGGGGGGGGFYGGGGGGEAAFGVTGGGGGGGGSSYVESSATHVKDLRGAARSGNGEITISWQSQK